MSLDCHDTMLPGSNFIPDHLKKFEFPWTPNPTQESSGNKVTFTILKGALTVVHVIQMAQLHYYSVKPKLLLR